MICGMASKTAEQIRADLLKQSRFPRTQKDLARKLGVSLSYLNMVIRGTREPAGKLLKALGKRRQVVYVDE